MQNAKVGLSRRQFLDSALAVACGCGGGCAGRGRPGGDRTPRFRWGSPTFTSFPPPGIRDARGTRDGAVLDVRFWGFELLRYRHTEWPAGRFILTRLVVPGTADRRTVVRGYVCRVECLASGPLDPPAELVLQCEDTIRTFNLSNDCGAPAARRLFEFRAPETRTAAASTRSAPYAVPPFGLSLALVSAGDPARGADWIRVERLTVKADLVSRSQVTSE
jgi:hypothetical protein